MTRSARLALILVAGVAATPRGLPAQSWVPVGPPGGDVRALGADPRNSDRIYLGTADGVFYRSDDGGQRWQRQTPGFPARGFSLDDIVVDRAGTVWVGFWQVEGGGGGVASSTDGGRSFERLPGIDGQAVRALAVSPSDPDTLVAGTMTGVFHSGDAGRSWRRISPEGHIDLKNVGSLALDPRDPRIIYAGTWHLPWKTTDGGRSWYPIHAGMIDDSDVMTLTLDKRGPNILYATACSGIYRSTDAAARWTRVRGIPSSSRRTRAFAQNPERPDVLYAGTTEGFWLSQDGGTTWSLATSKSLVVNAVLPLRGGTLLLGSEGTGVLRSTDGGRSWTASNQGFSERFVSRVVFDATRRRFLAGIWGDRKHGGVFEAPDAAGPWQAVGTGLEGREVLALAVAEAGLVAGTDDGMFLWTGAGEWRRLPTQVNGVELHPRVRDVAVVGRTLLAASSQGLLRSLDGGLSWKRPALGLSGQVLSVAASPRPGVVLAATPLGFFRSADAGDRWVQVARAFEAPPHSIMFLPGDGAVVFATTARGLYQSADQGETWGRCTGGVPHTDITGLAIHPDGRTLYASDFTSGGIFRSSDGGATWKRLPADGLLTERAWTLGLDPGAPDRVLAASPAGGLHLFVSGGTVAAGGSR